MKKIFLITTISILSLNAFAKNSVTKATVDTKLTSPKFDLNQKEEPLKDLDIQPFDFSKLMAEAEKYFKAAKNWEKIKCEPKTGFLCSKWECNPRETKVYTILDKKAETVTRCEDTSCETFDAEFEQTGVFVNVQAKGPIGTLIRVLGDSRYKEITTVGLDAYIANGNCAIFTEEVTDSQPASK
jgi:hypothetical protein